MIVIINDPTLQEPQILKLVCLNQLHGIGKQVREKVTLCELDTINTYPK